MSVVLTIPDLPAMERLGRVLAELLPPGTTVALSGTLGAGKTRLVQAVAVACGIPAADVTSPTFVLCREYHGDKTLYHADAYRLRDEDEFLELGPEEWFASNGLIFLEWAERVERCLPESYLALEIVVTGETSREVTLRAHGPRYSLLVPAIAQACSEL
jgi:tRNA threonylcarbamoyladenosine biosynthesis protein TsaE